MHYTRSNELLCSLYFMFGFFTCKYHFLSPPYVHSQDIIKYMEDILRKPNTIINIIMHFAQVSDSWIPQLYRLCTTLGRVF